MTEKELEEVKQNYIEHIKKYMTEAGGIFSMITVFAESLDKKEEDIPAIIHIPIPKEFLENDESKDEFIDELLPNIIREVKKKFKPLGIAWTAEAWMRKAAKDFDSKNYEKLPKQEVLFVCVETQNKSEALIYEIKRVGKQVNSEGDLTDTIELEIIEDIKQPEQIQGRFAGLYKKLISNDETN